MSSNDGTLAELRFEFRVRSLGSIFSRPSVGSATYDAIIDFGGKLLRIQVKSTAKLEENSRGGRYNMNCKKGGRKSSRPYEQNDFDFLVAYVIPTDTFYIIPISEIKGQTLKLYPHRDNPKGFYEQYKERWDLLSGDPEHDLRRSE